MPRLQNNEAGFTIVETLVAIVILVVGALTTFSLLSAANRNTDRAKATQVAQDLAQQEIEALRSLSNDELAMTATPPHSDDPLDPNHRVNSSEGSFALIREPLGSYRPLVRNGGAIEGSAGKVVEGGVVTPGPKSFENGDVKGDVYRYVVWANDEACGSACPTQQDYKQIIVAIKLDTPATQMGERGYVEVQSDFVDPTDSSKNDPAPDASGNVVTAQQFFLTDTACSATGSTERGEITADHPVHNTLGTCASGPKTGSTPGAPDALLLGGPPDPAPEDPTVPAFYALSNDLYSEQGLQILREDTPDCNNWGQLEKVGSEPQSKIHLWVTDPMESDFKMTEKVTLEFYTRTPENGLYTGTVCVYLFDRHEEGTPPVATDAFLTNKVGATGYWTYTPEKNGSWPRGEWGKVRLAMTFNEAPYTILKGDRLGLAISVERANTSSAIGIMYDHPSYATRIEVDTSTPIEGG
jgi:type II secretory pathway pseudopilin PulG